MDPETLDRLDVMATIKKDVVIYRIEHDKEVRRPRGEFPAGSALAPGFELLEALENANPGTAK